MNINNILNPVPDRPQSVEHAATNHDSQSTAPATNNEELQTTASTNDDGTVLVPSTNSQGKYCSNDLLPPKVSIWRLTHN